MAHFVDLPIEKWCFSIVMLVFFCMFTRGYHIHKNFESQHPILQVSRQRPSMLTYSSVISSCEEGPRPSAVAMVMAKHNAPPSNILYQHLSTVWGMFKQNKCQRWKIMKTFLKQKGNSAFSLNIFWNDHQSLSDLKISLPCKHVRGSIRNIQVDSGRWLCTSWELMHRCRSSIQTDPECWHFWTESEDENWWNQWSPKLR